MATQEITKQQKEQIMNIFGWLCAFSGIISGILQTMFGQFMAVLGFALCLGDRDFLKKYMGVTIPWGYCLITPLYMYQRAVRLKESKTKFIISLVIFCLGLIGTLLAMSVIE